MPQRLQSGLAVSQGYDSTHSVVDRLSQFAHFIPSSSPITPNGVGKEKTIPSKDQEFVSAVWHEFMM